MSEPLLNPKIRRRLEQLTLVSRRLSAGRRKGERRSRLRGASTEFADYRAYVAGDDLRHLDWKIYGRLERLVIKLFLEEEDLRVSVLLDASESMCHGEPEKLLYARRVAAALGCIALARMDSLAVRTFGDGLADGFGPCRGRGHTARLLGFLEAVGVQPRTDLARAFRATAQSSRARGLVVVISDFYDPAGYEDAFRHLFAANVEVLALHVLSPQELRPGLQGDLRLVDSETDDTADVSMGRQALALYRRTLDAFCGGIRDYVTARGGVYLLAATDLPFERFVLDVLRRKGIIR
jgi:uncharacterized protein (DUF58 family)